LQNYQRPEDEFKAMRLTE